jgi:hypothetical protein
MSVLTACTVLVLFIGVMELLYLRAMERRGDASMRQERDQ